MQKWDVLFSEMTPAEALVDEFNGWYDDEHIPLRMAVSGFNGAQRYIRDGRNYLAVYDLADIGALDTPNYRRLKEEPNQQTERMLNSVSGFSRYIGKCIDVVSRQVDALEAPVLYAVFFHVPADDLVEFDDWYAQDHVPLLMECDEWLACRRFDLVSSHPNPYNRLALHYLADDSALRSEARFRARDTEWRRRLAQKAWFKPSYLVFERHGERFRAAGCAIPSDDSR